MTRVEEARAQWVNAQVRAVYRLAANVKSSMDPQLLGRAQFEYARDIEKADEAFQRAVSLPTLTEEIHDPET